MNLKSVLVFAALSVIFLSPAIAQDELITLDTLGITPFDNDTAVKIDGLTFNIPKGYGKYNASSFDNETVRMKNTVYCQFRHEYKNSDLDMISILIYYDLNKTADSIDDIYHGNDTVKKTLNGHKGYLGHEGELCTFTYMDERKVVQVTAKNESVITSVIA